MRERCTQHRGLAARQPTRGDPAGGGRLHRPVPRVAGRQPLHLPRLPRVHPRRRRPGREPARSRERHRPRHPAVRPAGVRAGRAAEPVGPQEGPRAGAAHHHQGQLALDRAPGDLPRLRRRQGVRRAGARHGRAAVPRHLRLQRVCGVDPPHPDPRRARGSAAGARRLHAGQPLRQGPRAGHGELPARRAAPDRPGRPRRHRPVGDAPPGAAQDQAVPALRHLRAVRLRPHLPAPRPLQHDGPAEDGGHPAADVRRGERRLHDARLRVRPGPAALRGPGAEGRSDPAGRRVGAGARDRRGDADLGRGPRRGPAGGCGRRGRRPADRVVRQGFSRGVQGGRPSPGGGHRHPSHRDARLRRRRAGRAAPGTGLPAGRAAVQALPPRPAHPDPRPADVHPPGRGGHRRAALRDHPQRRRPRLRLRLRAAYAEGRGVGRRRRP